MSDSLSFLVFFVFDGAKVEIIFERQKKNVSFFNEKLTFYKIYSLIGVKLSSFSAYSPK